MVSARTDPQAGEHRGTSVFLLDGGMPGVHCHRIDKLGMRDAGGMYEVQYEGVRVPRTSLLGELHGGWKMITGTVEHARVAQAACCIGAAPVARVERSATRGDASESRTAWVTSLRSSTHPTQSPPYG
jgi:alkylation response protein AidB-like acyl-CoA dehydrogenase